MMQHTLPKMHNPNNYAATAVPLDLTGRLSIQTCTALITNSTTKFFKTGLSADMRPNFFEDNC